MIPIRLALRNFMSYTDVHEPLLLDGIHVACLSGENGAGKSTLLDAITWALWGYSRAGAGSAQHLVHVGKTDMEVEFEFRLAGGTYRVIRKWTAPRGRTGSGTSLLELSVQDGESFRSISGNSIRETDARIVGLLRMSYTTFTNSAFILQGRADAFTTRTPAERKQVLADILELGEYDRLQERARDEVRRRESRHRELEDRVREADAELSARPTHEAERDRLEAALAELDERLLRDDAALRQLQEEATRLAARERELAEAGQRANQAQAEVDRQRGQIAEHEKAIGKLRVTLDNADQIEQGAADLARTRQADETLNTKLQELTPLAEERNRLSNAISTARTRLEGELRAQQQHLARYQQDAARVQEHEQALAKARADQVELARLQARQAEVEQVLGTKREAAAELRGANEGLRKEMHDLKARITLIQTEPICPICRGQLDPETRARLTDEYTAEGKAQRARFDQNQASATQLDGIISQHEADRKRLAEETVQLVGAEGRLATAEHALETARRAAREVEAAQQEHSRLEDRLARHAYAEAEATRLREVEVRIEALGYDPAAHRRIRTELTGLLDYERLSRELAGARQAMALREDGLRQARASLASWQERLDEDRARIASLRNEVRDLPALRERLTAAEGAVAQLRRQHTEATSALGEARQRLSYLDRLEQGRAERIRELDEVLREKGLYSELMTAFGRNGIQAMLIETAIPEIEDEANRLLAQMTDGRMHVDLRTTRDRVVGEGQIETLDVVIHDNLGSRPYEMYSGGEAFRVNFALRIALSRLLAQRAGTRLETLVIDEGFGSQDQEGRDRLVEAIKSVEDEFAMILVITHLDDLKERFPVRIEVQKRPEGSVLHTEWVA
jgi:DNA repair protein SbcC/Rad50